jgi:hypothetical protein
MHYGGVQLSPVIFDGNSWVFDGVETKMLINIDRAYSFVA